MTEPQIISPNVLIQPVSASVNGLGHLTIGGLDVVDLANRFGTPLWIIDEQTVRDSAAACLAGLSSYPNYRVLYAGKAFLCLAMCRLLTKLGLGLDVVSEGELYTAQRARFPAQDIFMHGNNKAESEIESGLTLGDVKIVVDNEPELAMVARLARKLKRRAKILLRVTPGVEPDTHHYIRTGQVDSKFGIQMEDLGDIAGRIKADAQSIELIGLHAHIGSQSHDVGPYREIIDILAQLFLEMKLDHNLELTHLDVGGGLGIAYTETDRPTAIYDWSRCIADRVSKAFKERQLTLPTLLVEPGRSIIGSAGLTLYRAGHAKKRPGGLQYLAVDGGMADNPRPVTYQARYTAKTANRMNQTTPDCPVTLVGKFCESGDILVKDAWLHAEPGDLVAVFGTGAYNYSMASNYNRSGRPACVLVGNGTAEVIIARESNQDLLAQDRVPERLQ